MKIVYFIIFFFVQITFSQSNKEIDLIVVINDEVVTNLQNLKLIINSDKDGSIISPLYHPGSLVLTSKQYEVLISDTTKSIELSFAYIGKEKSTNYKMIYGKKWLEERFAILKIYDLNKKKYKKMYEPITPESGFGASIDFGYYSILNVKQ